MVAMRLRLPGNVPSSSGKLETPEGEPIWNKVAEEIDPVAARPKIYSAA